MKNLDELIVELRQVYDDLNELKESNKEKCAGTEEAKALLHNFSKTKRRKY